MRESFRGRVDKLYRHFFCKLKTKIRFSFTIKQLYRNFFDVKKTWKLILIELETQTTAQVVNLRPLGCGRLLSSFLFSTPSKSERWSCLVVDENNENKVVFSAVESNRTLNYSSTVHIHPWSTNLLFDIFVLLTEQKFKLQKEIVANGQIVRTISILNWKANIGLPQYIQNSVTFGRLTRLSQMILDNVQCGCLFAEVLKLFDRTLNGILIIGSVL